MELVLEKKGQKKKSVRGDTKLYVIIKHHRLAYKLIYIYIYIMYKESVGYCPRLPICGANAHFSMVRNLDTWKQIEISTVAL